MQASASSLLLIKTYELIEPTQQKADLYGQIISLALGETKWHGEIPVEGWEVAGLPEPSVDGDQGLEVWEGVDTQAGGFQESAGFEVGHGFVF